MKQYAPDDSDESDQEAVEVDVDKLSPLEIGPEDHKLQYTYCLWYHRGYKVKNPSVSESFTFSKSNKIIYRLISINCLIDSF